MAILVVLSASLALTIAWPAPPAAAMQTGGPRVQNDAGSGTDAGDSPAAALLIPMARRMWSANLTPTGTDSDWYRLDTGSAYCATVDATVGSPGYLTLGTSTDLAATSQREAMPHRATRLAIAGTAGSTPLFGIDPPMTSRHVSTNNVQDNQPGPGRYTFAFNARTHADLDPEADGDSPDAGSTAATSAPLVSGCSAGRLGGVDGSDAYHFDVASSREITVSFALAAGSASARIVSPTGVTVATLASGDAKTVWANEAGRWLVVVQADDAPALGGAAALLALPSTGSGASYLLGVTDGPGDTEPCRPTCRR